MSKSKRELGWDNDRERQALWVQVGSWQYKAFVQSFTRHDTLFQFDGVVSSAASAPASGLVGLEVIGDIEIPSEIRYPDEDEPPPDHHGTFHLVDDGKGDPIVGVILVGPEAFAELLRLFAATFGNNLGLGLQLNLKHPKEAEPDFWRTRWHEEDIQISHFGFYGGGHFRKTKRPGKLFS